MEREGHPVRLSVLDQSPIRSGGTASQAIAETLALAQAAERLGYYRYWVAEHHSSEGLAGTAPEILVARIAAATNSMRIGSGGVMLSHYSALKVAETFRVLETLYPGRIDLGIGRAPGSDQRTAFALRSGPNAFGPEHYLTQIEDLIAFLGDRLSDDHPFAGVRAMPVGDTKPALWLLGSSDQSAAVAAHFGCPFSFAHFITDRNGPQIMEAYREAFKPGAGPAEPRGNIGVFALCADTEAEADRLATSRDLWRVRLDQGYLGPFPSIEEAAAYPYSDLERRRIRMNRRRMVIGAPEQVRDKVLALCDTYGVDEVVVVTICHDHAARLRSYELLADLFGLTRKDAAQDPIANLDTPLHVAAKAGAVAE